MRNPLQSSIGEPLTLATVGRCAVWEGVTAVAWGVSRNEQNAAKREEQYGDGRGTTSRDIRLQEA
jgi:hypothetical protein